MGGPPLGDRAIFLRSRPQIRNPNRSSSEQATDLSLRSRMHQVMQGSITLSIPGGASISLSGKTITLDNGAGLALFFRVLLSA